MTPPPLIQEQVDALADGALVWVERDGRGPALFMILRGADGADKPTIDDVAGVSAGNIWPIAGALIRVGPAPPHEVVRLALSEDGRERRAEICQGCTMRVEVDPKGRVGVHGARWPWPGGCSRSNHPSLEELVRRKARRREVTARQIADLRDDATVTLDAFLEGRPDFADRIPEMRRVAAQGHRRLVRRRGRRTVYVDREPGTLAIVARCMFCESPLVRLPEWPSQLAAVEYMDEVYRHATECALRFLATYQGEIP